MMDNDDNKGDDDVCFRTKMRTKVMTMMTTMMMTMIIMMMTMMTKVTVEVTPDEYIQAGPRCGAWRRVTARCLRGS